MRLFVASHVLAFVKRLAMAQNNDGAWIDDLENDGFYLSDDATIEVFGQDGSAKGICLKSFESVLIVNQQMLQGASFKKVHSPHFAHMLGRIRLLCNREDVGGSRCLVVYTLKMNRDDYRQVKRYVLQMMGDEEDN